jgi:hypothetical protein
MHILLTGVLLIGLVLPGPVAALAYSEIVSFGDSLTDDAHRLIAEAAYHTITTVSKPTALLPLERQLSGAGLYVNSFTGQRAKKTVILYD